MSAAVAADAMAELRALSRPPPARLQRHDGLCDTARHADLGEGPAGAGSPGVDGLGYRAQKQTAKWASPLAAEGSALPSSLDEGFSETTSASHDERGGSACFADTKKSACGVSGSEDEGVLATSSPLSGGGGAWEGGGSVVFPRALLSAQKQNGQTHGLGADDHGVGHANPGRGGGRQGDLGGRVDSSLDLGRDSCDEASETVSTSSRLARFDLVFCLSVCLSRTHTHAHTHTCAHTQGHAHGAQRL